MGRGPEKKEREGGAKNIQEKPGKQQLRVSHKCRDERTRRSAPSRACGESKVEPNRGLGTAMLNINFCQQT